MASFNKLTIGNQTFDVSGVRELPAQWIRDEENAWKLAIPTDLDYQVGQIYQINYDDLNDDLSDKNSNLYTPFDHYGIETLTVVYVEESHVTFSLITSNTGVGFNHYTGIDTVTNKNVDVLTADECEFARISLDYAHPLSRIKKDSVDYFLIPFEILGGQAEAILPYIIFYCYSNSTGSIPVKLIRSSDGPIFVNINTGNSIPYEVDDNEGGLILSVEDVIASNSVSDSSSSDSVPVIAIEYQSGGDTKSITTTNKNEYEIVSSEAPDVTSTVLISDENSDYKFINNSYFNSQQNLEVDNASDSSYVKAEFVGNFIFSVGGGK